MKNFFITPIIVQCYHCDRFEYDITDLCKKCYEDYGNRYNEIFSEVNRIINEKKIPASEALLMRYEANKKLNELYYEYFGRECDYLLDEDFTDQEN